MLEHYDIIIIGAGAGGGTLAYALATTGKQILILERGTYLPKEKENWNPNSVFLQKRYQSQEKWLDKNNRTFNPEIHYYVGGNTKVYGAALQRMRAEDFDEVFHYDGLSPAWPFTYKDFELYYTRAEHLYRVRGTRGEDPTEPFASADYPFQPLEHEERIQEIAERLRDRGLHPYHLSLALDRNENNPEQGSCIRCATCDPYPCLLNAKCDAELIGVEAALQNTNVTLLTSALVTKLKTNFNGTKIETVEVEIEGEIKHFSADLVALCGGAINSALLLLRSANDKHPHGLANSSGLVGRNLLLQQHSILIAVSEKPNNTKFQKTLGINDFYFQGPEQNYPLGQIQLTGKTNWQRLKYLASEPIPQAVLQYFAGNSIDWWITTEDLPKPENCVTLNERGQVKVNYISNNTKPHQELMGIWENYLKDLGFFLFWKRKMPIKVVWHQAGTCRFGNDAQTSVLDINCRTHDIDNLYVVDGSFFPSLGAVNPTLTIIANALRVGDRLKERLNIN